MIPFHTDFKYLLIPSRINLQLCADEIHFVIIFGRNCSSIKERFNPGIEVLTISKDDVCTVAFTRARFGIAASGQRPTSFSIAFSSCIWIWQNCTTCSTVIPCGQCSNRTSLICAAKIISAIPKNPSTWWYETLWPKKPGAGLGDRFGC